MMIEQLKKEYLDRMKEELKDKFDIYINALSQKETHGFVLNLKKLANSSIDLSYLENLFDAKLLYKNEYFAYLIYDKDVLASKSITIGKSPLYHAGLYYIQEPSAAKVLFDANIKKDDAVLDLCASPGGKSIEALCYLDKNAGGFLISNEIDFSRAKVLSSNIERMGFENVVVTNADSKILSDTFCDYFDKIIVDAPCSGEGMMRKSEEARLQWSTNLVKSMAKIQKSLLDEAYTMLKAGGEIIYSTCTFSKEEDEESVEYVLSNYKDMKLVKMEKLYPFEYLGEGQFYAIFKKDGESNYKTDLIKKEKLKNINVLRYGVERYELKSNISIPSHASTHVDGIVFDYSVDLDDEEIEKYLKGEVIRKNIDIKNTFVKITYKKLGIGLAKYVNGQLKNHYPKGLRNI